MTDILFMFFRSCARVDERLIEHDDVFKMHDEDEPEDENVKGGKAATWSSVEVVTPEEAIKMEKCIVFTDTHVIVNMFTWECL